MLNLLSSSQLEGSSPILLSFQPKEHYWSKGHSSSLKPPQGFKDQLSDDRESILRVPVFGNSRAGEGPGHARGSSLKWSIRDLLGSDFQLCDDNHDFVLSLCMSGRCFSPCGWVKSLTAQCQKCSSLAFMAPDRFQHPSSRDGPQCSEQLHLSEEVQAADS